MRWVRLSTNLYIDLATLNRIEFSFADGPNMIAHLWSGGSGAGDGPLATLSLDEAYVLGMYLEVLGDEQREWLWLNLGMKPGRSRSGEARGQTPPRRADQADPPEEQPNG
jgi:hypothetical protein